MPQRQRNNDDQIPLDDIASLNQAGQPRPLDVKWRRKDKLRKYIRIEDGHLRVPFESVSWRDQDDGAFASLWVFTREPVGWVGRSVWPMRRADMQWERERPSGPGMAQEYSIPVPLDVLGVDPGEEFALCFATPTVRSAIVRYTMGEVDQPDNGEDEPDDPDGPSGLIGAPWPCFPDGRAPVLDMAPTGEMSNEIWGHWLDDIHPAMIDMGTDGEHVPMTGNWRPHYYGLLMERNAARGRVTAWWLDHEQGGGPAKSTEQLLRLIELYDSLSNPGWQIVGPTWDVWQSPGWERVSTVNKWIAGSEEDGIIGAQQLVGDRRIMIGARARRNPETGEPEQRYVGDYRAYEAHVPTGAHADSVFARAVQVTDRGVPVAEFERFRVRGNPIGEGKDVTEDDTVEIVLRSRRRRVAIIIGAGDARGNVSDVGSGRYSAPAAAAIKANLSNTTPDEPDAPDEPDEPDQPDGPGEPTDPVSPGDCLIQLGLMIHNEDQRLTHVTIGDRRFVDIARADTFEWVNPTDTKDAREAIVPMNNAKPLRLTKVEVFRGVLRPPERMNEEYTISVYFGPTADGPWKKATSPKDEKQDTGSHDAGRYPIFLFPSIYVATNYWMRVTARHSISGNAPHINVDLYGHVLWNTTMEAGPDPRKP